MTKKGLHHQQSNKGMC